MPRPATIAAADRLSRILEEISKHGNTRRAFRELNESNHWFYALIEVDKDAAEQYARAKRIGISGMADECIDISDDVSHDTITDSEGNAKPNTEWITRSKLRVDTRKWLLSKILPKVYGDKTEVELSGNVTLQVTPQDLSVL